MIRAMIALALMGQGASRLDASWNELAAIAADADSASAWADSARARAGMAHVYADSAVAWSDSAILCDGAAAAEARGHTVEFFERAFYAREETFQAWRRAQGAWRRALQGRNRVSESPLHAWQLQSPDGVIAFETHGRAKEARSRASAYLARAVDAEQSALAAVERVKRDEARR